LIDIPGAPAIPRLAFRRFRGEADFAPLTDIINDCYAADKIEIVTTPEEIAGEYRRPMNCDPSADMIFAEIDGEMIGFACVGWQDLDGSERVYWHRGAVHPHWRRKGIGQALFRWNEARARQIAATHPDDRSRFYQVWTFDSNVSKCALAEREGYTVARRGYDMRRDTLDGLADAPLPAGLQLRPVRDEHVRPIWDAMVEAFRDHWGAGVLDDADFERWRDYPIHDRRLWRIAWDGDQIAGVCINVIPHEENKRYNRRMFWIDDLAVWRPLRKRGVASALLVESMRFMRDEQGMTSAGLGVDTQNLSGALPLYERLGFKPETSSSTYRKPMR
jgi:GNAT superfamily N-acetyltransferase